MPNPKAWVLYLNGEEYARAERREDVPRWYWASRISVMASEGRCRARRCLGQSQCMRSSPNFSGTEGFDVAKQGVAMGAMAANVAQYLGGGGLRAAGGVLAKSSARYAARSGDIRQARDKAALTPEERDALKGKK
jgi:hypothetical protein